MSKVLGVDPSLTATAICWIDGDAPPRVEVSRTKPGTERGVRAKLERMHRQVGFVCDYARSADAVLIEGLAFAAHDQGRALAGLWWMLLAELALDVEVIGIAPPAVLKKWATGTGNADKFRVGQNIVKRWPGVELSSDDQSDALVLASIGLHSLNALPWTPTAFQVDALAKVEWDIRWSLSSAS